MLQSPHKLPSRTTYNLSIVLHVYAGKSRYSVLCVHVCNNTNTYTEKCCAQSNNTSAYLLRLIILFICFKGIFVAILGQILYIGNTASYSWMAPMKQILFFCTLKKKPFICRGNKYGNRYTTLRSLQTLRVLALLHRASPIAPTTRGVS